MAARVYGRVGARPVRRPNVGPVKGDGRVMVPETEIWPCGWCGAPLVRGAWALVGIVEEVPEVVAEVYCCPGCRALDRDARAVAKGAA